MRILRGPSSLRIVAALAVAVSLLAQPAYAVPTPAILAKQREAAQAQAALDVMRDDLEVQVEEYNKITEALHVTRARIAETRERLAAADAGLSRAQALLEGRVEGMYRRGQVGALEVFLGTTSFEDFLTRLELLSRIGVNDAQIVASVRDLRQQVLDSQRALEQREAEQITLRAEAAAKKEQVEASFAKQDAFVASLNTQVAQLIKEQQEREEAAAKERARRLAEAQAAARKAGGSGRLPLGEGHPEAVALAMKYIGVPYVWGGTTPAGFDCSGLVQYVYRQLGIEIPRVSQDQFYAGARIPADRLDMLRPGDLVFFGRDKDPGSVHHVGMYAGGDDFIEAPFTGSHVKVSSFSERLDHGEYVGASRF